MKWISITFALLATGSGVALFRIHNIDPRMRAMLHLTTVLGLIAMAPITLKALNETYLLLRKWGVVSALRDFFRNDPLVTSDTPPTQQGPSTPVPDAPGARHQPRTDPAPAPTASEPSSEPPHITWVVTNHTADNVLVKFWQAQSTRTWPPSSRVYRIRPGRRRVVVTKCASLLQTVCYGAWGTITGRSGSLTPLEWGRGIPGDNHCPSCCYRCNGATVPLNLAP